MYETERLCVCVCVCVSQAGSRSLPPEVSKELDTLRDRCAKLERLCDDLEHRAAEERTQYESRLAQAMEDTQAAQREALEAVARAKQGVRTHTHTYSHTQTHTDTNRLSFVLYRRSCALAHARIRTTRAALAHGR